MSDRLLHLISGYLPDEPFLDSAVAHVQLPFVCAPSYFEFSAMALSRRTW